MAERITHRGYLLHMTHYDPVWWANKKREKPFDFAVAKEILNALADQGFNMLLVSVFDAVCYSRHPELKRHYSQPISVLEDLAHLAREKQMQVVPELNFSRSEINRHNQWMRKDGQNWHEQFDDDAYFALAFDAIDEVIKACRPENFFHVGMDEDHDRSHRQFAAALLRLRDGLAKRKLRTVSWSDTAIDYASGDHYREKSEAAEVMLTSDARQSDMVRILWNYWGIPSQELQRIARQGFELWGAPGGKSSEQITGFRDALLESRGKGLIMTHWIPCIADNRNELLQRINSFGHLYH